MKAITRGYNRKYINKTFITNDNLGGYKLTVIDGGSKKGYVTIQIKDWIAEKRIDSVIKGLIKYPFHPCVRTFGFIGDGKYSHATSKDAYGKWIDMLRRCYDTEYQERQPAYIGASVISEWHNFQNFAKWHERYYPKNGGKYDLDKDLLSNGSKSYSLTTCIFIPRSLNSFMANIQSNNTSGYTGVHWNKQSEKWRTMIRIDKKIVHLGSYHCIKTASRAYQEARAKQVKRWQNSYSFDYPKSVLSKLTTIN